jgi:hypothetical protein
MEGLALGEARLLSAAEWSDIRQTARHALVRTNDVSRRRLN